MVHREVGGSNSESQVITQVVDSLDNAIGINIAVASSGDSISSLQLLLGRKGIAVSIVELSKVILGMVLSVGSISSSNHRGHRGLVCIVGSIGGWHIGGRLGNWGSLNHRGSSLNNRCIGLNNRVSH